jgi:hypothetical protein
MSTDEPQLSKQPDQRPPMLLSHPSGRSSRDGVGLRLSHLVWVLATVFVASGALLSALAVALSDGGSPKDHMDVAAQVVGTIVSALAFAALVFAIFLQRRELSLQLEELADTRLVMREQRDQLEFQSTTFRRQSFDGTFFQLLRLHHEIVGAMILRSSHGSTLVGREALIELGDVTAGAYQKLRPAKLPSQITAEDAARFAYRDLFQHYEFLLGHYFRNLYHIVRFVERSQLSDIERYQYTSFVRAQLSSGEVLLLFFNGLAKQGERFKPLIEKYALLKQLPREKLDREASDAYDPRAFQAPTHWRQAIETSKGASGNA